MEARPGISDDAAREHPQRWDMDVDILVVGFGAAGAVAAIEAARAGSITLILEKMPFPGGLSAASAGGIRITDEPEQAFSYLQATCGGRTPDDILRVLAAGMAKVPAYIRELAQASEAEVRTVKALGNYPLPGYESLGYCEVGAVPAIEAEGAYGAMRPITNGTRLFKVLEDNVRTSGAQIRMQAAAERLITDESGAVVGLFARLEGRRVAIRARQAVVLTCGGFEADRAMQQQYFAADELLTGSFRGNTGDGIRMAQAAGADLWHMWHHHGPYGLKHPDPDYPFALYLKAVPMWTPGRLDEISTLGVETGAGPRASARKLAPMAWIAVDRNGRRFMDEYPPYPGDAGVRPFDVYDFKAQTYARSPAFIIFDEEGRKMYPMGRSVHNDTHPRYQWSKDNLKEVENGLFQRADTLAELAAKLHVTEMRLIDTIERWNAAVRSGRDDDFGRQPETMRPVSTPPYYAGRIYPILINTQGGPRHDRHQRVLDPFGEPIPGLYAAGELGSVFGHVYVSGGNLAECIVGGWRAARHAAGRVRSESVGAAISAVPFMKGRQAMDDFLQEHNGGVAILTLNRPAKLNALNAPMLEGLAGAVEAAERDEAIRVILLRGEGRSFCAGVDRTMVGAIRTEDEARRHAERMAHAQATLLACTKPVVAAVQGHALGAGCGLVSACDFVVASSSAVFGYPEIANRMLPALVTPGLVKAVGSRRAMALLLSSRRFDATEALQLGLVTTLAKNAPFPEAMELAKSLAAVPVRSIETLRALARAAEGGSQETAMKMAAEANIAHRLQPHDSP